MNQYFQQIIETLSARENQAIIAAVYAGLFALALLLRVIACSAYRAAHFSFRLDAKDLKVKEDIKKIKNSALRKVAAEYIRVADKSVSRIPTLALINRQVDSMSLLGWRYVSLTPLVESLETGLLFAGVLLAFSFGEYAFLYGAAAACGFVLTKICASFFDFRSAKSLYSDEMLIYVEREIGRFFAADSGGAVLRLKDELTGALASQSATLKESIEKIGAKLAEAVDAKLSDVNRDAAEAMGKWEKTLGEAGQIQEQMNKSSEKMQIAGDNIMSASDLLAKHLQGHSNALTQQLSSLVAAVEAVRDVGAQMASAQETLSKQSEYIETNQRALEATVESYERALQGLAQTLGDGIGAYIRMHSQASAQTFNESIAANIERSAAGSLELTQNMQALFAELRNQNRELSANLLSIHEKLSGNGY